MKANTYVFCLILALTLLVLEGASAQVNFQCQYGNAGDNIFSTKVLRTGSGINSAYYVLGRNQGNATVTRLDASGTLVWTRALNIQSQWNDMVLTSNGNLLLVGNSLPFDATNKSLAGLITPAGTFTWVRTYDVTGREFFARIVRSPAPDNASFPYYIVGGQYDPPTVQPSWEDVVLLTMSEAGNFGWKKYFDLDGDEEFFRDLDVLPNGDLILTGNESSISGILVQTDKKGMPIGGAVSSDVRVYQDLHPRSGPGFFAVGLNANGVILSKFDNSLVDVWHTQISGLSTVSQVWEDAPNGWIYVVGTGFFAGKTRAIVVRLLDIGTEATQDWAKFLDKGENNYTGGALWPLSTTQMAFVDGRTPATGGYGLSDGFMSVSDLEFNTCMTVDDGVTTSKITPLFNGPVLPDPINFDIPVGTDVANTLITSYQQLAVCAPCKADFTFAQTTPPPCGNYQFTNTSVGSSLTYMWNFGDPASGANNTSTAQNPTHLFGKCGTYNVCLKITGPDCMDSICKTVTYSDLVKPSITCPANITIKCDQQLSPFFTGTATATDNCTPNIVATYTDVTTGLLPCDATVQRTWTATDACGNTSVCTQIIFVRDDVPPVLNCPQSQSVNTLPGVCHYAVQNLQQLNITATDNCRPVTNYNCVVTLPNGTTQTWTPQTQFEKGDNKITCTVTDFCNNKSQTCMFVLTVKDGEAPNIICPYSMTVIGQINPQGQCKATVNNIAASVQDNCPMTTLTYSITGATTVLNGSNDASGTAFMQGLSTVAYTVTDMAGNAKTCRFNINVHCFGDVGGVIGVKYRECNGTPYTNQETIAGWPIALYAEDNATLLSVTETDETGMFAFYDMPYGVYWVREFFMPGWTPNVPASGEYLVEIKSPQPVQANFGNCQQACEECPKGSAKGPNLVTNGDFELGNDGSFSSGYPYFSPAPNMPFGQYSVMTVAEISAANPQWACTNRTLGSQKMLVVDGVNFSSNVAWTQTINNIQVNNRYIFCAFVNNLVLKTKDYDNPQISLWINNAQIGSTIVLSERPDLWFVTSDTWLANSASAVLEIRVGNTSAIGTDFAIDDIAFNMCSAVPCAVSFNVLGSIVCGKTQFNSTVTGISPFTYCWDFDGNLNTCESTLPNPMWSFPKPGTYVVTLKIADATGCMSTISKSVYVPPFPTSVIVTGNLSICQGQNTVLTASGGPWATCQWSTSNSGNSITVSIPGTYCVTCTDNRGCTASGCATVTQGQPPIAIITGNMNICTGQSTTLTASGGGSYLWSQNGQTTAAITVTPLATTTYTVTVTGANGCTATATKVVTVGLTPAVTISPFNPMVCQGDNLTLTASGTNNSVYTWAPGGQTGPALPVNISTPGTYSFTVTANLNGCTATTNVVVTVKPLPVVNITGNTNICAGQNTSLTASGGGTYLWSFNNQTSASINVTPTITTTYTVTVSLNGCAATATKVVTVNQLPMANAGLDQNLCMWQQATLTASGGGSYLWAPGNVTTNSYNTPPIQNTTTYTVVVTGTNGCTATDQVTVNIKICDCETNPIVQNGKFETGNPCLANDEDIQNAANWNGIWPTNNYSTGDFYNASCSPTTVTGATGNYAGFWVKPHCQQVWREGIRNQLSIPINPNSGLYEVSMRVACIYAQLGTAVMEVYGVPSGGSMTSIQPVGNDVLTGSYLNCPANSGPPKLNTDLFVNPAGGIYLGQVQLNAGNCSNNFTPIVPFTFNSNTFTNAIDGIYLTRADGTGGTTYALVDDVCIKPVPAAATCDCGKFFVRLKNSYGLNKPLVQGQPAMSVPCLKPGGTYTLYGLMRCNPDQCGNKCYDWKLDRPNNLPDLTGQNCNQNYPWFFNNFTSADLSQPGLYTFTITRKCGTKDCTQSISFILESCPCSCDALEQDVNNGFSISTTRSIPNKCDRILTPLTLCPDDQVDWTITPSPIGSPSLSSTGNNPITVTLFDQTYYTICMTVTRVLPNGTVCPKTYQYCKTIKINCQDILSTQSTGCPIAQVKNGGFNLGVTPGFLDQDGNLEDWEMAPNPGDGQVFVQDSSKGGALDEGYLVLTGGMDNFAGIIQEINLEPKAYTIVKYEVNNLMGNKLPKGTRIEFRLQNLPYFDGPGLVKQKLYTEFVDTSSGWVRVGLHDIKVINPDLRYLVICLQNDDPNTRSVIGLDNLEVCTSEKGPLLIDCSQVTMTAGNDGKIYFTGLNAPVVRIEGIETISQIKMINVHFNPGPGTYVTNTLVNPTTFKVYVDLLDEDGLLVCEKFIPVIVPLGTNEKNGLMPLRLYPNPNPGLFTLELPIPATTGMRLRITDPTGRLLQDRPTEPGLAQQTIEANELPNGLYFLQVVQDGKVLGVERFVKQE